MLVQALTTFVACTTAFPAEGTGLGLRPSGTLSGPNGDERVGPCFHTQGRTPMARSTTCGYGAEKRYLYCQGRVRHLRCDLHFRLQFVSCPQF
jgi:hypothetical protein